MSVLARELAVYNRELPSLLSQQGRFVLIHGDEVAGTFHCYEDALQEGYRRFDLDPFLVKEIQAVERPILITRLFAP